MYKLAKKLTFTLVGAFTIYKFLYHTGLWTVGLSIIRLLQRSDIGNMLSSFYLK